MERIEKTVFISYRRTNIAWALAIFQNLKAQGYDVFFDYNGIASGDFERVILGNITARAHFLVLLTPSALERCDSPTDWLRREIETALDSQRNIVPLMLEEFDFGAPKIASQLTGRLAALKHYNALRVPPDYFDEAMERLRSRYLNVPLTTVLHPVSPSAQQATRAQKAAANAAPLVQQNELTAQQWFERGYAATDTDEKIRHYTEAIRLKPDYADVFINRGTARTAKGDIEGAIRDYEEAIRLKPDSAEALSGRGNRRKDKGDIEGAIQDYDKAIRLKPDYADAFIGRGIARKDQGDIDRAIQDYDKAIRLKPGYAAFTNRGVARQAKGDIEGAIQDYQEAIRLKPNQADAFYNRGTARQAKDDIEGAIQDYDKAIQLKPDHAHAFRGRGIARRVKGDIAGSEEDFKKAERLKAAARA